MSDSFNRFVRQAKLVPRTRLANLDVTVVGVGAIGRQAAVQLAALGVGRLQLVDFDRVEPANVTTQGYFADDVGRAKVEATADAVRRIDANICLELVDDRYRAQVKPGDALFCCVDSIDARRAIWRIAGSRVSFWCDGRMLGEVMRVLTATDTEGRDCYPATLFRGEEALAGSCTARGTFYSAAIAAGLMLHQFTRWLRRLPTVPDLTLNLLASECVPQ